MNNKIMQLIEHERYLKGWTVDELVNKAGTGDKYQYSRYINGSREPSESKLVAFADALGMKFKLVPKSEIEIDDRMPQYSINK